MKTVFFDVEDYEVEFLKQHNDGNFILLNSSLNSNAKIPRADIYDAEIISVFTTSRVGADVLEKFPNLKLLALRSVGFNHIDADYCKSHGIAVETSPNYGNKSVAEFAFALMLNVCRKIFTAQSDFEKGTFVPTKLMGYELGGKTVGIIGVGAIGAEFAHLAHGFDMKILGFDLYPKKELVENYGVEYVTLNELFECSDFISLHAPLTENNFHIINEGAIEKMKPSVVIINTARGEHIDTEALYNALKSGKIAGAGLDVLESENSVADTNLVLGIDRLSRDDLKNTLINTKLFQLPNVIITPHIAYNTHEAVNRILKTTIDNIEKFKDGKIQNRVI